ncbi:MAG: Tat pathway signal protein [Firmicutes bacterium]|nr:Tat pathway signal protein [Bacillota bacterium]
MSEKIKFTVVLCFFFILTVFYSGVVNVSFAEESATLMGNGRLLFPKENYTVETKTVMTSEGNKEITYRYYKYIPYVAKPVDLNYQSMNVLVPIKVNDLEIDATNSPILLKLQVYGFMPYHINDDREYRIAEDLALAEGYVLVKPAVRGRTNVTVDDPWSRNPKDIYYGKAPACVVDMKAVIRYLRHNKDIMPGNVDWIIAYGGSAGGGVSAVLGASGNNILYEPYLQEIGAANEDDDILASACFSPMLDFENGDLQYEWMFGTAQISSAQAPMAQQWSNDEDPYHSKYTPEVTNKYVDQELSAEIAVPFADYLVSLNLQGKNEFGTLTTDNYDEYILKYYLIPSANKYLQSLTDEQRNQYLAKRKWIKWDAASGAKFTWEDYVNYLGRKEHIPVFDSFDMMAPETSLFGNESTPNRHFTNFSLQYTTGDDQAQIDKDIQKILDLMNPIYFLLHNNSDTAKYWWIRHGTAERGTSMTNVVNLVTLLENQEKEVNTWFYWDGGHMADLDTPDFIKWINKITGYDSIN